MKKVLFFLYVVPLLCTIACRSIESTPVVKTSGAKEEEANPPAEKEDGNVRIVDDDLTRRPFGEEGISSSHLLGVFTDVRMVKEPVENRHDTSITDTLIDIETPNGSLFRFYKYKDEETLIEAQLVETHGKDLKRNIHIGMKYTEFIGKIPQLAAKGITHEIIVTDTDELVIMTFHFSRDETRTLEKITYWLNPI